MLARVTDIFTVSDFSLRFVRVHLVYLFFGLLMMAYFMCMLVGRVTQDGVIETISSSWPCCTYTIIDPVLGISYEIRQLNGHGYMILSPSRQRYAFIEQTSLDSATLYYVEQAEDEGSPLPLMIAENINAIAWSADSDHLAFSVDMDNARNLFMYDLPTHTLSQITQDGGNCTLPAWSPDERYVAAVCEDLMSDADGIYLIDRTVSSRQRIADETRIILSLQWAPDGTEIAFHVREVITPGTATTSAHLYSMDPDGSDLRQLTPGDYSVASFAWSPDSTHLLFLASLGFSPQKSLFLMSRDGSNIEPLAILIDRYTARIAWYADFGMQSP